MERLGERIKKTWHWIWYSDSVLSWIVALIIIFIFVKYIFFPVLSLIMGTSLPLAGVESSSMDHQIIHDESGTYNLCGTTFTHDTVSYISFDEYWRICGEWYEEHHISKDTFSNFHLKNGFKKGDIVIVWGRFTPKVGDIIIYKPNTDSLAPRPIVHRIISIEDERVATKGDHNREQLTAKNNYLRTDETEITQDQIIGKVILKIPYLGWFKIWMTELLQMFF